MQPDGGRRLPSLSSLCGACTEACPVGIPLHDLLVRARAAVDTPERRRAGLAFRAWSQAWRHPALYRANVAAGRLALRLRRPGWIRRLPGPLGAWTDQRDIPTRWPPTR